MLKATTLIIALVVLSSGPSTGQTLDLDALAKQPGTEVIRRAENGEEIVEIRRGGVSIMKTKDGTLGFDRSGKFAVLCVWEVMVEILNTLDVCFPDSYPEVRVDASEWIAATNEFIVANSLTPTSKSALESEIEKRLAETRRRVSASARPGSHDSRCQSILDAFISRIDRELKSTGPAERRRILADFLSVPRPPVMNPCL